MNKALEVWKEISQNLESFQYPKEQILQHGGIPADTVYDYVVQDFVQGFVNHVSNHRIFLINRYGPAEHRETTLEPNETYRQLYERLAKQASRFHIKVGKYDDTIVIGESDSDFWIFWYDLDVSDCAVWRISKDTAALIVKDPKGDLYRWIVEAFTAHLRDTYDNWQHDFAQPEPIIVEIEKPKPSFGWISAR